MPETSAMGKPLDYDSLRADTVCEVAKLMAAITAPKSGGQLFLAGKHLFIDTGDRRRPRHPREAVRPLLAREGIAQPDRVRATSTSQKPTICSGFSKPSDGLEPSTPSLPWRCSTD